MPGNGDADNEGHRVDLPYDVRVIQLKTGYDRFTNTKRVSDYLIVTLKGLEVV